MRRGLGRDVGGGEGRGEDVLLNVLLGLSVEEDGLRVGGFVAGNPVVEVLMRCY